MFTLQYNPGLQFGAQNIIYKHRERLSQVIISDCFKTNPQKSNYLPAPGMFLLPTQTTTSRLAIPGRQAVPNWLIDVSVRTGRILGKTRASRKSSIILYDRRVKTKTIKTLDKLEAEFYNLPDKLLLNTTFNDAFIKWTKICNINRNRLHCSCSLRREWIWFRRLTISWTCSTSSLQGISISVCAAHRQCYAFSKCSLYYRYNGTGSTWK